MGQRSQIYIRYNNGDNIVAYHLQWNYGRFMINRAYQLLRFIEKNTANPYSNFLSENFDMLNGHYRYDHDILASLIQMNSVVGSYCAGHDLIDEHFQYTHEVDDKKFKLEPKNQDNNDGILVIDIQEQDGKPIIKYGFVTGDNLYSDGDIKISSAVEYMRGYQEEFEYYKKQAKTEEDKNEVLDLISQTYSEEMYIDNFKKLTLDEYKSIFIKEYSYEKNLMNYKEKIENQYPRF